MPKKIIWTDQLDTQIRQLRADGETWDVIALVLGLARQALIQRWRQIGAEQPPAVAPPDKRSSRPLASGDAGSWNAINRATSLDGEPFAPVAMAPPVLTVKPTRAAVALDTARDRLIQLAR